MTREELRARLDEIEQYRGEDDYVGQTDEHRRQMIVEAAIEAAEELISEGTDGSVEETESLTAAVAKAYFEKLYQASLSRLLKHDLEARRTAAPF